MGSDGSMSRRKELLFKRWWYYYFRNLNADSGKEQTVPVTKLVRPASKQKGSTDVSWKDQITNETERKVLKALDDRNWSWRTLAGLSKSADVPQAEVFHVLSKYKDNIRVAKSEKYGAIYQLLDRTEPAEEPFIERALDYLSMGRRRIA